MDRYQHYLGCLLGTALADAVGLRREGLSPRRAVRLFGEGPLEPNLLLGRGLCSDDTEHTQMVGRALVLSQGDPARFRRHLARQLRCWLLTVPAGIGLATLRSCCKLLVGCPPTHSGVFSAGNGPAMRSALLGLYADNDQQLRDLVRDCTRITHTDPKAEQGALLVAQAAGLARHQPDASPVDFLRQTATELTGSELGDRLQQACQALEQGLSPADFASGQGWAKGVGGYVNHTVPAALYCWASSPHDFRQCIEHAVRLGGDTDSVAAIAGAICGAHVGRKGLPEVWVNRLAEWPRTVSWTEQLATALADSTRLDRTTKPPSMHWMATLPRNALFATIVLGLGFRRLLPPY